MTTLAGIIRNRHAEILERWTRKAQQSAAARGLDRPEFQNVIPAYLLVLADAGDDLGRFTGKRREQVESHLSSRLRQGSQLPEIVEEFALLGSCIAETWNQGGGVEPPQSFEVERLFAELHAASVAVTELFASHMLQDEQAEKQYLRLIQTVAREALQPHAPDLRARLEDVLELVREAMGAQSSAMTLCDPTTGRLEIAAAVGMADEELERYACSLGQSSLEEDANTREESAGVTESAVTELRVSDVLRRSGIRSLLRLRLPPRHRLLAIMYVGLAEERAFSGREVGRLESLGEQLTLHLDNARLYADLREQVERLDAERELRERFVSVLAHDLRGPLAAAKISSQILMRRPESLDERRALATRIDHSLERADRMIRDLLDANRIRAGQRLPLRIDECDLAAVAREVVEELVATFGERFVLEAEGRVMGFWSAEELHRALWNLGSNAVKYGAADASITVSVRKADGGVQTSVHNWGTPISPQDQTTIFRPFSRSHAAQIGGQRGWGLGLTLVHGCAVAHGGHVEVRSSEQSGTTFMLALPFDARPFQPRSEEVAPQTGSPPLPSLH